MAKITVLGVKDEFVSHATVDEQLMNNELTVEKVSSKLTKE